LEQRNGRREIGALGDADRAHPVEAERAADRRQTQDQQQPGEDLVDAIEEDRIAMVEGDLPDQHDSISRSACASRA